MNSYGNKKPPGGKAGAASSNPFARALAETEKFAFDKTPQDRNPLSEALAHTGGSFGDMNSFGPDYWGKQQQAEAERKRKQEALRKKLHDQVNPVDTTDIFNAREKKVKEEIDKLREDLKLLAQDVAKFDKEIELTLMTEISDPGEQGKYYINFFQKLRALIMLLRQKIKSARTWATQLNGKKKKKKKRGGGPMLFEGKGHQETKTIYDMMHHEVSNARSGG